MDESAFGEPFEIKYSKLDWLDLRSQPVGAVYDRPTLFVQGL